MIPFTFLDRLCEASDNINEEDRSVLRWVSPQEVKGSPWGEWRALIVGVVEHLSWVDKRLSLRDGSGSLDSSVDGCTSVGLQQFWCRVGCSNTELHREGGW